MELLQELNILIFQRLSNRGLASSLNMVYQFTNEITQDWNAWSDP